MLDRITAPLVLPQRLLDALDSVVEALAGLPAFERAVLDHLEAAGIRLDTANGRLDQASERLDTAATDIAAVRESAGGLAGSGEDLVATLTRTEATVRDSIAADLTALRGQVADLERAIGRLERRLPDPDAPGPLAKARDAITGDD